MIGECCGAFDRDTCAFCVREMNEEAERLEAEATDLRVQAMAAIGAGGLCKQRSPGRAQCCGKPYDCEGHR